MLDKDFFNQYQKQLVWFANTKLGKWFFKIDRKIDGIGTNYISWKDGENITAEFRVRPKYSLRINRLFSWLPTMPVKASWGWYLQPRLGLTVDTFYPNPATGTDGIDGTLYNSPAHTTWASIRDAASATSVDASDNPGFVQLRAVIATNDWDRLHRFGCGFDTSAIGSTSNITAATLSLYISAATVGNLGQSIGVTAYAPASNSALATGDYDSFSGTRFASDISIGSITTSAYNNWAFNTSGLAAISKTGVSNFMFRTSGDIDNSEPTIPGTQPTDDITIVTSDNAGTTQDPKLVVTYNPVAVLTVSDTAFLGDNTTIAKVIALLVQDIAFLGDVATVIRVKVLQVLDTLFLGDLISEFQRMWTRFTKNSTSYNNQGKNNTSTSNQSKNSTTLTNQSKN